MAQCAVKLRNHPTKVAKAGKSFKLLSSDAGPLFSATGAHKKSLIGLDISDAIVQTMACELREQESLNNKPTNLIINNGRGSQKVRNNFRLVSSRPQLGDTGTLVFKASAYFGRAEEMIKAASDAYVLLRSLTRKRSGLAVGNYAFYVGEAGNDSPGRYIGKGIAGAGALKGEEINSATSLTIIGPLTTYGRKLYWNPAGGKKVTKRFPGTRNASRKLGVRIKGGFIGTETIHTDVKKRMRRKVKYKALSFSDPFYEVSAGHIKGTGVSTMGKPLRMPAITVQMKKQGRLG